MRSKDELEEPLPHIQPRRPEFQGSAMPQRKIEIESDNIVEIDPPPMSIGRRPQGQPIVLRERSPLPIRESLRPVPERIVERFRGTIGQRDQDVVFGDPKHFLIQQMKILEMFEDVESTNCVKRAVIEGQARKRIEIYLQITVTLDVDLVTSTSSVDKLACRWRTPPPPRLSMRFA